MNESAVGGIIPTIPQLLPGYSLAKECHHAGYLRTDKATVKLEAPASGVMRNVSAAAGVGGRHSTKRTLRFRGEPEGPGLKIEGAIAGFRNNKGL